MFLFQRNTSPESRRASTYVSPTTSPISSHRSHRSHSTASNYQDSPSPRVPYNSDVGRKRSSLFTLRARSSSNTASSRDSLVTSLSTATSSRAHSRRASREVASNPGERSAIGEPIQKMDSPSKARTKVKRRTKLSLTTGLDSPSSNLSFANIRTQTPSEPYGRSQSAPSQSRLSKRYSGIQRSDISAPFNFQHITHTQKQQLPALDIARPEEVNAAFQAAKAAQEPTAELHGIQAHDLHFKDFSPEHLEKALELSLPRVSQNSSPVFSAQDRIKYGIPSPPESLKSRSMESICSPISPLSPQATGSFDAFHRGTSKKALASPLAESESTSAVPPTPPHSDSDADHGPGSKSLSGSFTIHKRHSVRAAGPFLEEPSNPGEVGAAQGDTRAAVSPAFTTGLENVPEEPEQPADSAVDRAKMTPFPGHAKSFPVTMAVAIQANQTTNSPGRSPKPKAKVTPQPSDTLGASIGSIRRKQNDRPRLSIVKPQVADDLDSSWEDDVDFCYEHAAEADCEFDWSNTSKLEDDSCDEQDDVPSPHALSPFLSGRISQAHTSVSSQEQGRHSDNSFRWSRRTVSSRDSVPELDHHSSDCGSTASTSAPTPADRATFLRSDTLSTAFTGNEPYLTEPSMLLPHDPRKGMIKEESYEELVASYESPDQPFQYRPQSHRVPPRPLNERPLNERNFHPERRLRGTASANELRIPYSSRRVLPSAMDRSDAQHQQNRNTVVDQSLSYTLATSGVPAVRRKPVPPTINSAPPTRTTFGTRDTLSRIDSDSPTETSPVQPPTRGLSRRNARRVSTRKASRKVSFTMSNDSSESVYSSDGADVQPLAQQHQQPLSRIQTRVPVTNRIATDPLPQAQFEPSSPDSPTPHRRASSAMALSRPPQRTSYNLSVFPTPPKKSSRRPKPSTAASPLWSPA